MSGSDEDDVFTFTISDGTNEVTKTITITADTVDDTAPTLTAETISVGVGNTVVFDGGTGNEAKLLANDNDNNSEGTSEGTLAISKVNGVAFGSLQIQRTRQITTDIAKLYQLPARYTSNPMERQRLSTLHLQQIMIRSPIR